MGRYQDALEYIFGYVNYEKQARYPYNAVTFDLSRMEQVLEGLGRPHERFRCVHIAGTKGKGSTSAMVESVLRTAGYRTGLYTSPHLHTFRERIRLTGGLMTKAELVDLLERCKPVIEATPGITAFEVMTALAFQHFAEQGVEWAVLEVGLGGRLDATNVVHPAVAGITSLSYDHVELLGHTLSLIAFEKAGIIKPGVPLVSAAGGGRWRSSSVYAMTPARLVVVGRDWQWEKGNADRAGRPSCAGAGWPAAGRPAHRPAGAHQRDNATTAIAMLYGCGQGLNITDDALRTGLATAQWPGRFELLNARPPLVVDSAHNDNSAQKLRAALATYFPQPPRKQLALIFGASSDKDIIGMLKTFLGSREETGYPPADKVIVTRSGHPRSANTAQLADLVREVSGSCPISVQPNLESALAEALAWAGPDDLICVTGSIFVVAQARRAWAQRHPEVFAPDDWVFQDETAGEPVPD